MHNTDSRGIRYALMAAGFLASTFALVGSCVLNFRYGHTLARTPADGLIFGVLAIASDVFMAASLFFYFEAKKKRAYTQMLAAIVVWVATTAFAGLAAISQASMNRIDAVAHRTAASTAYADTRTELTEARKTRDKIGVWVKTETAAKTEIEKHKTSRAWTQSSECQEIAGKSQREYCSQYQTLVGELATAQQVAKLDKRIEDLVTKSDTAIASNAAVGSEADPAAASIAGVTGQSLRGTQTAIIFGFAGLILVLCSLGPYITSSMLEGYNRKYTVVTIEPEPLVPAAPEAIKLEPAKLQLALPKPAEPPPTRPEISPEWRILLDAIDYPRKKGLREPQRPQDKREVVGLRWFVWMVAHNHVGEFTATRIEQLYDEFANGDYPRDRWGINVAKGEMRTAGKPWITVRDSKPPTTWTINTPTLSRIRQLLIKRKLLDGTAKATEAAQADPRNAEAGSQTVVPFVSTSGADALPAPAANDEAPAAPRRPVQGLAELTRHVPDLRAMGALERAKKHAWEAKAWMPHRKQQNRMRLTRAA